MPNYSEFICQRFKVYDQIKQEFVDMIYYSFLPIYLRNQIGSDSIMSNVKWDVG